MGNILSGSSEFNYSIIDKSDINDNISKEEFTIITQQPKESDLNKTPKFDQKNKQELNTCFNMISCNNKGLKNKYNKLLKT